MQILPAPAAAPKPRPHHFTADHSTPVYTVQVSPTTLYGWFEHHTLGDRKGGGLWFEHRGARLSLVHYDGVMVLPTDVCAALHAAGYHIDPLFWPNPATAPAPHDCATPAPAAPPA